jgi:hypothetical protein
MESKRMGTPMAASCRFQYCVASRTAANLGSLESPRTVTDQVAWVLCLALAHALPIAVTVARLRAIKSLGGIGNPRGATTLEVHATVVR